MTTIRIRGLRKKTRDLMATAGAGRLGEGATLEQMRDPVEILVHGTVRAVVHFLPKTRGAKGLQAHVAWTAAGWQDHGEELALAALRSKTLSDKTEPIWKTEAREAGQEARA